jgi:SAM-dependent methyltransferase
MAAMTKAQLLGDSSLPMRTRSTTYATSLASDSPVDDTAYSRIGPYLPQIFDLRTPAARSHGHDLIELASATVGAQRVEELWREIVEPDEQALIRRLQFISMELYYRASEESLFLAQRYNEYRIYNWPKPAISPRITLLDAGSLENAARLKQIFRDVKAIASTGARSWRLVSGVELLSVAQSTAKRRLASPSEALNAQLEAHGYLESIDLNSPLRQDHQRFVEFLPDSLGATLEIGSGFGQLARVLVQRSGSYLCVDLNVQALVAIRSAVPAAGVVADLHHLPVHDGVFDSVIANNVLEHVYDPLASLTELRRVLKPGGSVFGLMPMDFLNADYDLDAHRWKADARSVEAAFAASGFRIDRREELDLYALGVRGCFPSCNGRVLQFEAILDVAAG